MDFSLEPLASHCLHIVLRYVLCESFEAKDVSEALDVMHLAEP